MSSNIQFKISIVFPIFFTFLFIASLVGIIGNAISLNSAIESEKETDLILGVIASAVLALFFILAAVFSYIEVLIPQKYYQAKIFTDEFDKILHRFAREAESWELMILASSILFVPFSLGASLQDSNSYWIIVTFVVITFIPLFTYNNRMKLREKLRKVLPSHPNINLSDLSNLLSEQRKKTRRSLLYLISYEKFPAQYNFDTEQVIYLGSHQPTPQTFIANDVIPLQTEPVFATNTASSEPCAYCGAEPLVEGAKFCAECGASMIAAKT